MSRWCAPLVPLFLLSCATGRPAQLVPGEAIPAGEAAVLGRIEVFDGATQVIGAPGGAEPAKGWGAFSVAVAAEDGSDPRSEMLKDGRIRWRLRPGKYGIWGFGRIDRNGTTSGPLRATFEVPAGASAVYLGTLRIRFGQGPGETHAALHGLWLRATALSAAGTRDMPRLLAPYSLEVADELEHELRAAAGLVPRGTAVARSVLRLPQDATATDPSLTATGRDAEGTLFRVVKPTRPVVDRASWPEVERLDPSLEWENLPGVVAAGLAYDLRISRAIQTSGSAWGSGPWTWGPVVYLRTNLQEPRHRVEAPLAPSTAYFWEVRLRRGDAVGPWSAYDVFPMRSRPRDDGASAEPPPPPEPRTKVPMKRAAFAFRTPSR